jgi:NAD(P)-dependent dehydrogenase (short-subunit alcohol dehydrogenase family)
VDASPRPQALPREASLALEALPGVQRDGLAAFYQAALKAQGDPLFPAGALDVEGKPLDLRPRHTWRQLLHEVQPLEMAEVWLVNVLAPMLLNSLLRQNMERSPFEDRYIVNVSAVEGQFSQKRKMPHHPHTNMAKAALNMMTRTCGQDYAGGGIYMTSVDTGWITDENAEPVRQSLRQGGFLPPLDAIDGAARVYDPVVRGINQGERLFGVFLKDYRVTAW